MKPIAALGLGLALLLSSATVAEAKERRHRVRAGETASGLAKHYYGASWKSAYILTRNQLSENELPAGRRLTIPASWTYTARSGDSYASIAKRMVGNPERYTGILRFNRLSERTELQVGQELLMPFHLRHTVAKGESLSQISRRYYRTTKLGGFLAEYNFLESPSLEVGQRITVPIFDRKTLEVANKPSPPAPRQNLAKAEPEPEDEEDPADPSTDEDPVVADSQATPIEREPEPVTIATPTPSPKPAAKGPTRSTPDLQIRTVQEAVDAYQSGYFRSACPAFETMLEGTGLQPRQRSRVIRFLGYCSVAYGDERAARDYLRSWLLTDPEATLDRRLTSPKILQIFDEVAAEVRR